jgi:syntaxin 18
LTDRQREEIDAQTKQLLRELNAGIRNLADAEQLRQNTETTLTRKKYARLGLGALGSWAAGGAAQSKSYEQEEEESRANAVSGHRESVLWYLRQKLQECGSFQASMMEKRIMREVEKNRSVLANARPGAMQDIFGFDDAPGPSSKSKGTAAAYTETQAQPEPEFSPEQIQMFEKQNQDMLKHYESTLDQVRYVAWHFTRMEQDSNKCIGLPRSPWSRYRSCRRNWSITLQYSRHISTNWCQIRFIRQKMSVEETSS